MPASRRDWADAYGQQSSSDFLMFETLSALPSIPLCHRLHYLQMSCEKIAKAYQFRDLPTSESKLTRSHVAFSKFINTFLSSPEVKQQYQGRDAQFARVRQKIRTIAREIEKLASAVDREQSPSNAEYPWEAGEQIAVPCHHGYPNLASLREPVGVHFLKLIREAILSLGLHGSDGATR